MEVDNMRAALNTPGIRHHDLSPPSNWVFYLQGTILLTLLYFLYSSVLASLFRQWAEDANYSHGFFVPLFSVFLLWKGRHVWKPSLPSFSGLVLVIGAMGLLIVGTLGAELFLPRVSFVLLIGGLVVYFAGWQMLRALLAPWLVLSLMIPIPVIVFNEIAFPLQLLASRLASSSLELLRVPVLREGNIIVLSSMSLDVVEACSGIRSLMSLICLAVFYVLLVEQRRQWIRWLLVVLAVPVALAANAMRIVGSALLAQYAGSQYAEGFFHAFSGWLIFALALGLLIGMHRLGARLLRWRKAT
jgi:exosortase